MRFFKVQELVSRKVYDVHGDSAIRFIDPRLIANIVYIRQELNKPIIINDWHLGGIMQQRGLRENTSKIVKDMTALDKLYLSAHVLGCAVDMTIVGMSANDVRDWIVEHKDEMPYPFRLEADVNWVHLDVLMNGNFKYQFFKA